VKGLSPRKSTYLRSLLIEAAWIAVRHDPALTQTFARLIQRMPKQQAIIRIAKKLLSRIRHVWLYKQPYVPTVGE
ncbi:MAG: IS110 family transposase, partial [Ignavibacteriales bacterium]|nr:IS110 family transposase [Ignavibacteriales bacterium]